jgi:hypothetical protein
MSAKDRRNNLILGFAVSLVVLFFISLRAKISAKKASIQSELAVFDSQLDKFDTLAFSKVSRPYADRLFLHYPYKAPISAVATLSVKRFDDCISNYSRSPSEKAFHNICETFTDVPAKHELPFFLNLLRSEVCPLTLSVFLLAPLPSEFSSSAQSILMKNRLFREDPLLAYLASLRLVNIYRGFFILPMWLNRYDTDDFSLKFGNPLNYRNDLSLLSRFKSRFASKFNFSSESQSFSFEDILKNSTDSISIVEFMGPLRLDISVGDLLANVSESKNNDLLVVKMGPGATLNFVQVSETVTISGSQYILKCMVLQRKEGEPNIMLFDENFLVWTLFTDENMERILSFPRQFARKFFNKFGTHLIYEKKLL